MQPGVSSNSGSQPHQATVTVSFLAFNGPEDRNIRGATTLGTGNGPASYTIHKNELVVMDRRYNVPGHVPTVFSSLSGLEFDARAGNAGLKRRLAAVGVAINHIHFNSASGLANQRVTVVTNGLVPISWTSEFIEPPSPGDLVVAYPPSTDPAERERQLQKVSDNAAGQRYQGDIVGDARTPMLMRKFTGTEMDDLAIDALEYVAGNLAKLLNDGLSAQKRRDLSPTESFAINVIFVPTLVAAGVDAVKDPSAYQDKFLDILFTNWGSYMTTPLLGKLLDEFSQNSYTQLSAATMRNALLTYRNLLMGFQNSVIGRIVGTRIDGMVPIFLG